MTIGNKIKDLRKLYNLTQGQLAYKLGITAGAIAHWESGNRKPSLDQISLLSEVFNVTSDFLIGLTSVPDGEVHTVTDIKVMNKSVPVYGRIPAGVPFEAIEDIITEVEIPSWLSHKRDLFGLKVIGDSMSKICPDGFVCVLQKTDSLNNGEIGAILVNGFDASLKKFYKLTDSVVLEPLSYNPEHKPMVIDPQKDEVVIIGRMLWCCADRSF